MKKPTFINSINQDYAKYCMQKLQEIDPSYFEPDANKKVRDYHRYKFRTITPKPRQVFVASDFSCPPKLQPAYVRIAEALQKGRPILPYQSRMLKSTDYDDAMLMDWGVQHLHLGSIIDADGFAKRTSELLFVRITPNSAYVIGVFPHKEWTNLDVIEVLHSNWPSSIESFKLNGVSLPENRTKDELTQLRKIHVNSPIKVSDGTIYTGPGMGTTCAGTPLKVQLDIMKLHRIFEHAFETIELNYRTIFEQLKIKENYDKITIGLVLQENNLVYVLKEAEKGIILNQVKPENPLDAPTTSQ